MPSSRRSSATPCATSPPAPSTRDLRAAGWWPCSREPASPASTAGDDHVGGPPHGQEPPSPVADSRLAEGDRVPALQDPSLGEEVAATGARNEAHVEVERGLADAAFRSVVKRAEGAPHRGIDERAVHAPMHRRARGVAQLVPHGRAEAHPPWACLVHLDAEVTPEQIVSRPGAHS